MDIIQFEHISKNFGAVHALKDVSFGIASGECHAIIGENGAGKSTLMHILAGAYGPTEGKILLEGREIHIPNAVTAQNHGIAIVYQELKLCLNLTASENIFLGKMPANRLGFIKRDNLNDKAQDVLSRFGVEIDVTVPVRELSPAQMQLIEIAKAIMENARVLILDEPTSSLTQAEAEKLFEILRNLKAEGKTLIFISHRMNEIFEMADRITVLRDGSYLGTYDASEMTEDRLVRLIAGEKRFNELYAGSAMEKHGTYSEEDVLLELKDINNGSIVQGASLKLHRREILGLYGLQGAGRTELVETVFGMYGKVSGVINVKGNPVHIGCPADAIRAGFGLITEDRKNRGIYNLMNIRENVSVIHNQKITKGGIWLDDAKINDISNEYVEALSVRLDSIYESILNLSGGNQQKVILARMLSTNPDIILADEPTRGVDVGAKAEIFAILNRLKEEGKGIIVISSELAEIVKECDRVLVLRGGRIVGEVISRENREEKILQYAFYG